MPSATPHIPKWERPGRTTEELDWADIKTIDLTTFNEPGGKEKLAEQLRDAVRPVPVLQCVAVAEADDRCTKRASLV